MAPSTTHTTNKPKKEKKKRGNNNNNDDDDDDAEQMMRITHVMPISDVVYAKAGLHFRHSVQLKRCTHTVIVDNDDDDDANNNNEDDSAAATAAVVLQTVSTGDLVLVADDDHPKITKHFRIDPWRGGRPWRVGQVLGIVSHHQQQQQQQQQHNEKNQQQHIHHQAIIQWLLPMQYVQEHDREHADSPWVDASELKKINQKMRPDFMLWQQQQQTATTAATLNHHHHHHQYPHMQSVVDLHRVLPAAATLLDQKFFQDKHQLPTELVPDSCCCCCLEFYFHCHYMLPAVPGGEPVRCGPRNFVAATAATAAATAATCAKEPPDTVAAGWQQMVLPELFPGFSLSPSNNTNTNKNSAAAAAAAANRQHAKLVAALTASYDASVYQKPAVQRFQLIIPVVTKAAAGTAKLFRKRAAPATDNDDDDTTTTVTTSTTSTATTGRSAATVGHGKTEAVTTRPTKTRRLQGNSTNTATRAYKAGAKIKAPTSTTTTTSTTSKKEASKSKKASAAKATVKKASAAAADPNGKRHRNSAAAAAAAAERPSKNARLDESSDRDDDDDDNAADTEGTATVCSARGPVCFVHKIKQQQLLLHFYNHVELVLPQHQQHHHRTNNKPWKLCVGDLIAVALEDAHAFQPIYSLTRSKKLSTRKQSEWYPFQQPWCPAQVLAIYKKGGVASDNQDSETADDTFMQIRWFYRPFDLPEEVIENLSKSVRKDLFDHDITCADAAQRLLSGRKFVEVDEDVLETSVAAALGRIVTTTLPDPPAPWLSNFINKDDGVPQLPIICRHIFRMAEFSGGEGLSRLNVDRDWTDYSRATSSPSRPFDRGLACPKAWPGRLKPLFAAYGGALERQIPVERRRVKAVSFATAASLATETMDRRDESDSDSEENSAMWPEDLLSWDTTTDAEKIPTDKKKERLISVSKEGRAGGYREFLQSIPVTVVSRRCDPRATAKKSSTNGQQWTLQIGDIVCVAYNGAKEIVRPDNKKKRWFPFLGPWRVCQVLSIYRDVTLSDDESIAQTFLEVRWFLRESDLSPNVSSWMPVPRTKFEQEEVFESDLVEVGIPASHVLGCVELYFGQHTLVSNPMEGYAKEGAPTASCRCRYFYHTAFERFQPLFCSEVVPRRWFQRLLERGFKTSASVQTDEALRQGIELCLDVRLDHSPKKSMANGLLEGMIDLGEDKPDDAQKHKRFPNPNTEISGYREYFLSTSVGPSWSKYAHPDVVCAEKDRTGLCWTVRVGDIVAIETADDSSSSDADRFPYNVSWRVAQILSIFQDRRDTQSGPKAFQLQIRWFYRRSDRPVLQETVPAVGLDLLYSSNDVSAAPILTSKVLGPVYLFPGTEKDRRACRSFAFWDAMLPYLPIATFTYAGHFDIVQDRKVVAPPLLSLVKSGFELSSHYSDDGRRCLLDALRSDARDMRLTGTEYRLPMQQFIDENSDPNDENVASKASTPIKDGFGTIPRGIKGQGCTKAWTSVPPFYIDHSTETEYFSEVDVVPPDSNFAVKPPERSGSRDRIWTVRLGDLVILHSGVCAGRASYQYGADAIIKSLVSAQIYSPFCVSWAVGEVVTIMRQRARSEAASPGSCHSSNSDDANGLKLEIRWFYREKELSLKSKTDDRLQNLQTEEICESDHYDEVVPSNLLAPAILHGQAQPITIGKSHVDMPVIEFHCHRSWSVHRKCLKPVGSLEGRIERGRLHSKFISRDVSLKSALQSISLLADFSPLSISEVSTYSDAFSRVIHKLSLTDASKEAYESSAVLIGREKERKQIMSFLRASISGDAEDSSKASLFVAGPPGTGKTASVRAVIAELQREQSAGRLPSFDFITLNGMEMRDPFEAYVKLWEEVQGDNAKCSAETAASRLEAHFSGKFGSDPDERERVSVVLLDEIDYLVTKKQSVLYNFFDWPSRSLETKSKKRLVVIGVSNTLNLPERLHPRVQSRIGSKRIFFKSYSVSETVAILNAKLQQASPNYEVFDQDAILYASKKTAALSGDIRKAFQICRSAAEMILNEANNPSELLASPMVRIKDVLKVSRESTNAAQPRSVGMCTSFDVLFLVALAALSKTTGREYGGFDIEEITTKMESMANAAGDPMYLPPPTLTETLGMLPRLRDNHLVSMKTPQNASLSFRASLAGSGGPWPLVSMVMDDLAVLLALKQTPHHDLAQKYLSRTSFR